eukprot:jgi/Bigna1/88622/estExt_fgenesh1_pg.C_350042
MHEIKAINLRIEFLILNLFPIFEFRTEARACGGRGMGSWPSKAADHSDSTLILWIRSCGGWVHSNIEIREGDKGERAVFIREGVGPIRAGSDLFRIPLNLLLTLERAKRERLQGKKSFWHPYISSLPKNPPGLSLLHGALTQDDDAKRRINIDDELRGTLAGKEVKAFAEIIHDDFKSLCSEDEIFKQNINLKDFVWARFMVSSRVFRLDWESMAAVSSSSNEEGATMLTMVPLADMLNHSEDHNCDWRFMKSRLAKTAHFRMTAREGGIGSGVEACDTYGKKPNHIFLAHYGFALPKNRRDMAEIVIHLSQDGVDMKTRNCENKESCLATTTKKENNKFYDNLRKRMMHHKREGSVHKLIFETLMPWMYQLNMFVWQRGASEMSGLLTLSGGEHEESENVEVASRRIRQQIRNSSMEGSVITQPASNNLADILTFLRLEVASSEKLEEISGIKTLKELLTWLLMFKCANSITYV